MNLSHKLAARNAEPKRARYMPRQHGHWRSVTVTPGSTDSVVDLGSRKPCGYGHDLCEQGVRGRVPLSPGVDLLRVRSGRVAETLAYVKG